MIFILYSSLRQSLLFLELAIIFFSLENAATDKSVSNDDCD